jgi:hypothetical protein
MAAIIARQSLVIPLCPGPFMKIVDTARDCMWYLEDTFEDDSSKHLRAIVESCKTMVERWNFVRSFINSLDCTRDWTWDTPQEVHMRELGAALDYVDLFVKHRFSVMRFQIEDLHSLHSCLSLIDRLIGDV